MESVLKEGIAFYNSKQYRDALSFFLGFDAQLKEDYEIEELTYYTGLTYARLQRFEDALPYLEQIVTSGNNLERINQCRLVLAVVYSMTDRVQMAEFELRKLLEGGTRSASVFCALAYCAWEQKNDRLSVDYYEKALEIESENPTALNGLGYVLACTGHDLTRALMLCKRAVDYVPDSSAFLDSIGWVYYKMGLDKEAKGFIKRAIEKNPDAEEIKEHYRAVFGKQR